MATSNEMVPAKPMDRFKQELAMREGHLRSLLPQAMTVDKFQAIVVAAVADNMDLLDCDRASLLKACLSAAELGLSLNKSMGEADILKVWDGRLKRNVAQFRPRYKGLMKLALQAGEVLKIESRLVYANDVFEVEQGIDPRIIHKHGLSDRGDKIGAYCVWKLKNGESQFEIMSKEEILAIRDRSSSKTKDGTIVGPWKTDEAEMWRKTVVRRASKYMPLSTEAQRAVMADNQAEGIIDADDYSGNEMDITDFDDVPVAEAQVQTLEEKIVAKAAPAPAPASKTPPYFDLEELFPNKDDEGEDDWDEWAIYACEIVAKLSPEEREAWRKLHEAMLEDAELMAPRNTTKLMKLFQ
jgi:recombination protein RecT